MERDIFNDIIEEMRVVYTHDNRPWMIGFSGGKDSTLLVTLVMKMLMELPSTFPKKKVYIVSSDTGVENPIVRDYMHRMSKQIGENGKALGIEAHIIYPPVEKSFWSCLIGLGYPSPEPPGFRWCTDKLKIKPINEFTLKTIQENGEVVMLLGVRKAESQYRARGIEKREVEGKLLVKHTDIDNAYVYNPLTEIPNDIVWKYLLSGDAKSPWGSDNNYLFQLYQGESLGEEESSLGQIDKNKIAVTGNSRFGCWVCTMVVEDKSLKNFIDKGHSELIPLREFRDWLVKIRNNPEYRDTKRRNGSVYLTDSGELGFGSFSLRGRREILKEVLKLEERTHMQIISEDELRYIDMCWEKDGDLSRRALVDIYYEIKKKKLPWDEYRTPLFDDTTISQIEEKCEEYDVSYELIAKLATVIDQNKFKTRSNKTSKTFDQVLNQGWIHHQSIMERKGALDDNEN